MPDASFPPVPPAAEGLSADPADLHSSDLSVGSKAKAAAANAPSCRLPIFTNEALQRGIDRGEFVLWYQPICRIADRGVLEGFDSRPIVAVEAAEGLPVDPADLNHNDLADSNNRPIVGVEALLRWNHPELGIVAPNDFIPSAIVGGLMPELCKRVISSGVESLCPYPHLSLSLNASVSSLSQRSFLDWLKGYFQAHRDTNPSSPQQIYLEIVEDIPLPSGEALQRIKAMMGSLLKLGLFISIDDFGFAYSTENILKLWEYVGCIKLDRSITSHLQCPVHKAIAQSAVLIANSLNAKLIAEGVEEEWQEQVLIDLGYQFAQGYFYGKPSPDLPK